MNSTEISDREPCEGEKKHYIHLVDTNTSYMHAYCSKVENVCF